MSTPPSGYQKGSTIMSVHPIRTASDYRAAVAEIETLMNAGAGTPEGERLDVLATLVDAYEGKHFPLEAPHRGEPRTSALRLRLSGA